MAVSLFAVALLLGVPGDDWDAVLKVQYVPSGCPYITYSIATTCPARAPLPQRSCWIDRTDAAAAFATLEHAPKLAAGAVEDPRPEDHISSSQLIFQMKDGTRRTATIPEDARGEPVAIRYRDEVVTVDSSTWIDLTALSAVARCG